MELSSFGKQQGALLKGIFCKLGLVNGGLNEIRMRFVSPNWLLMGRYELLESKGGKMGKKVK